MPGTAAAVPSQVTIREATGDPGGVDVRGNVNSSKRACKKNRRVRVYHDVDPPGPSAGDFLLGETVTNRRGRWSLSSTFLPDKVYAQVSRATRSGTRCGRDTSPTVDVDFN